MFIIFRILCILLYFYRNYFLLAYFEYISEPVLFHFYLNKYVEVKVECEYSHHHWLISMVRGVEVSPVSTL